MKKKAAFALTLIVCAVLAIGLAAGNKLYDNPGTDKPAVFKSAQSSDDGSGRTADSPEEVEARRAQAKREDDYIQSHDGLKLRAYTVKQPMRAASG